MKSTQKIITRLALAAVLVGTLATGCGVAEQQEAATSGRSPVEQPQTTTTVGTGTEAGSSDEITAVQRFHRPGELVSSWANMAEYLQYVTASVETYWTNAYRAGGVKQGPSVHVRWMRPGEKLTMNCVDKDKKKEITGDRTAAYCPGDDTIYVSQQFAVDLWNGALKGRGGKQATGQQLGDFAVAMVIAHEYGHNVQEEMNIHPEVIGLPNFEQQADCLAGVWAKAAENSSMLDPGDIEQGLAAAWLFGAEGSDHGNEKQRMAAFYLGYQGGSYSSCTRYGGPAR